jgi:DNA-binding response OmpR family regulator
VCDDDAAVRYADERYLRAAGYQVASVATGRECLELADRWRPALVLLDVRLPDMSGREVCGLLKADPSLRRIVVVHQSGVDTGADAQAEALEADADGYLVKPVPQRFLLAQVRAMLRIREAEGALVDQQERELQALGGERPGEAGGEGGEGGEGEAGQMSGAARAALRADYEALLRSVLEERTHRVELRSPERLRALAERLHALQAGPREVVSLHTEVVRGLVQGQPLAKAQAYVEEGRLAVLELMGHLLTLCRQSGGGRGRPRPT